jgi:hypothetical protein
LLQQSHTTLCRSSNVRDFFVRRQTMFILHSSQIKKPCDLKRFQASQIGSSRIRERGADANLQAASGAKLNPEPFMQ